MDPLPLPLPSPTCAPLHVHSDLPRLYFLMCIGRTGWSVRESTNGNGWYNSEAEDDDQDQDQDQEGRARDGLSRSSSTHSTANKVMNKGVYLVFCSVQSQLSVPNEFSTVLRLWAVDFVVVE